tara:strand:+ start:204 stop:479 length:276 start_codon:yes stop_codon:yes gene_type:complete
MTSHVTTPQGQAKARTREHPHRKYRRAVRRWAGRRRRGRTGEAEGKKKEQKKKRKRKKKTRKTAKRSTREKNHGPAEKTRLAVPGKKKRPD